MSDKLPFDTAYRLRAMLGDIQKHCMVHLSPADANQIVIYVSERGFRLIDEMEGVVR
jgi:hypothetical protein